MGKFSMDIYKMMIEWGEKFNKLKEKNDTLNDWYGRYLIPEWDNAWVKRDDTYLCSMLGDVYEDLGVMNEDFEELQKKFNEILALLDVNVASVEKQNASVK